MGQMGREGFGDLVPVVFGVAAKASCLRHGAGAQTLRGSHARPTDVVTPVALGERAAVAWCGQLKHLILNWMRPDG